MADLFTSVMEHAAKYSKVTTMQGAFAFNQAFDDPVLMEEKTRPPQVQVEIIDAVQSEEKDWAGVRTYHIEYLLKMSIEGNDSKIKIVGKRFSELSDLHRLLTERKKIDPLKAPTFPDKNNLHQNWWKLQDKDPSSDFVKQRRAALETYFIKLFEAHPGLPFDPLVHESALPASAQILTANTFQVMTFFQLEELSMEAAIAQSVKTAK